MLVHVDPGQKPEERFAPVSNQQNKPHYKISLGIQTKPDANHTVELLSHLS